METQPERGTDRGLDGIYGGGNLKKITWLDSHLVQKLFRALKYDARLTFFFMNNVYPRRLAIASKHLDLRIWINFHDLSELLDHLANWDKLFHP